MSRLITALQPARLTTGRSPGYVRPTVRRDAPLSMLSETDGLSEIQSAATTRGFSQRSAVRLTTPGSDRNAGKDCEVSHGVVLFPPLVRCGAGLSGAPRQRRPDRRRSAGQAGDLPAPAASRKPSCRRRPLSILDPATAPIDLPSAAKAGRRAERRDPAGARARHGGGRGAPARRRPDPAVAQRRPQRGHAHRPPPARRRRHNERQPRLHVPRPGRQRRRRRHGQHSGSGMEGNVSEVIYGRLITRQVVREREFASTAVAQRHVAASGRRLRRAAAGGRASRHRRADPRRIARGRPHHRQLRRRRPGPAGRRRPGRDRPGRARRRTSSKRKTKS